MNILVTGNKGYIGSVLVPVIQSRGINVTGYDTDYYRDCELCYLPQPHVQVIRDIRDMEKTDLAGIDAVIHLAALSNDPLGELDPSLTEEINYTAAVRLAQIAKESGVKRFIYSSSQSMYGISGTDSELDEDDSEKNPVTAYAATKWKAECDLKQLADDNFTVVCFRPSTVQGPSPKLRCDIVFNNLVACAYTTGSIEIQSDGSPWRPVVHVLDVCRAFMAGIDAPCELVNRRSYNVGVPNGNFTVKDLACAARKSVPGSSLVFTGEHGHDSRTYRVSFNRILTELEDFYKPRWDLKRSGSDLVKFFKKVRLDEQRFRGRKCTRLAQLEYLLDRGQLDSKLRWR